MKKLVIILIVLIGLPSYIGASTGSDRHEQNFKKIHLRGKIEKRKQRSLFVLNDYIEAYIYANNITISYHIPPKNENTLIRVSNSEGEVLFENNYTVTTPSEIDVTLDNIEESEEEHFLEIISGDSYIYGYF